MKLKTKKRKGLYIETSLGVVNRKIKQLQSYFFQGGKWKKVKFFIGG